MNMRRTWIAAGTLGLLAVVALIGCSKNKSTNPGGGGGTVELGSTLPPGGSFNHPFAAAGSFPYHCSIHPIMTATITVATGGADSAVVNITGPTANGFQPQTVTVKVGGSVRWTNSSSQTHTVTSN